LYAASKGGVATYSTALAKEFGPQGIRVNWIFPVMIAIKLHDDFTKDEIKENFANTTPLKRGGKPKKLLI